MVTFDMNGGLELDYQEVVIFKAEPFWQLERLCSISGERDAHVLLAQGKQQHLTAEPPYNAVKS